ASRPMSRPASSRDTARRWMRRRGGSRISSRSSSFRKRRATGSGRRCRSERMKRDGSNEMDFRPTQEQEQFRDAVKKFAEKHLAAGAHERAHASGYPWDVARLMAK